jgi:hypothetical protein
LKTHLPLSLALPLLFLASLQFLSCNTENNSSPAYPVPLPFQQITMQDELLKRSMKNFDRLETDIYQPQNIFSNSHPSASLDWPGDFEGRTILALVLEAQATHREPVYLNEMMRMLPLKLNKKGYFGAIQGDTINEQQLSGHGWLLRGLCEYYIWKKDEKAKKYIQNIIQNLALPTRGHHKDYPILPEERKTHVGEMSGTSQNVINNWLLSSDIGCDFVFLDGVVQAYSLFPTPGLKSLIDEMIARFLQIDLVAIKAQTHATLTALRALMRYDEITGDQILLNEVISRYQTYRKQGITENYENFNWFCRPEWTEPCAIIDSYILAVQLWQKTGDPVYLEDAHHIYYNAICHTQRDNGGFGCDNCTGPVDLQLKVKAYEAYWCCTMRGGEGLARAIQYNYFTKDDNLYIPFFHTSSANIKIGSNQFMLRETSGYPFNGRTSFKLEPLSGKPQIILHLFAPAWTSHHEIRVNEKTVSFKMDNGFITFPLKLDAPLNIAWTCDMVSQTREPENTMNTQKGSFAIMYGPLVLGYDGPDLISFSEKPVIKQLDESNYQVSNKTRTYKFTSVYQLLDPRVKEEGYQKQVMFLYK